MTRVLIVASSAVVRAGLESILATRSTFEVATVSAGLTSLPETAEELAPDVVLVDLDRQASSSASFLPSLEAGAAPRGYPPAFVLLLENADAGAIGEALRAGAGAVLQRGAQPAEIIAAVEAAAAGLVALPAESVAILLPVLARGSPPVAGAGGETLTPREIEVLGMMAEGTGNKLIARRLGISEHTVKFHVGSILAKLGASSRTEAVTMGVRQALIMV